jgi:predicted small metal-binding protein
MTFTLTCKDFGTDCPYIARGETEEEVLKDGAKHAKEAHDYTDEQINDPNFLAESRKLIKKT